MPAGNERDLRACCDERLVTFDGPLVIVPHAKRDFVVMLLAEPLTEDVQDVGSDFFCGFGGDAAVVVRNRGVSVEKAVLRRQDQNRCCLARLSQVLPQNVERRSVVSNERRQQTSLLLLFGPSRQSPEAEGLVS